MQDDLLCSRQRLERILMLVTLALGLVHAWVGRYSMNPDGMSYLDVGDSFFRHDWANAVNAWWSPLYPWTVGLVLGMAKPAPRWEFPLVHLVNFGIFVVALFAFRFLLHSILAFSRPQSSDTAPDEGQALPEWALVLIGYCLFWWIGLEVGTLYVVSPDLAVVACICLASGMLLHVSRNQALWKFALFGLGLGLGYWTKTVLFPLGFVVLGAAYLWKRSAPDWGRGIAVAGLVFACVSLPLIFLLSQQKGRFTFGDSGKNNYAWYVSPRTFWRNWQGVEPGSGTPVHSTRQLLQHPPLFEFDGPVAGTYPPWTDPSYWNEGLQWHFKLKPQIEVLATSIPSEIRLLLRARPELTAGLIALTLLSGPLWLVGARKLWPFIAISIVGMGIYLPLVENDRYLGGPVLVLFLTLMAAIRLRADVQKCGTYVAVAVFLVMTLSTADYTVRVAMNHMATPGSGPDCAWRDVIAAEQLQNLGFQPGERVAVIGDGTGAFWARLAKLRIVAEIMDANHGSKEFWDAPEEVRQEVYDIFAHARANMVLSLCPPAPTGWQPIAQTPYCVRSLQPLQ